MKIVKAPSTVDDRISVFLAGSIEMGKAENWQEFATKVLSPYIDVLFNPRRDDWDSSWKQESTDVQFREQVLWELTHIEKSTFVFMYFDPSTKSPISLLELGICTNRRNVIVVCPEGFWRRGNVMLTCEMYHIECYSSLEAGLLSLKNKIKTKNYV